jgi:hypothetical protein
MQLTITHSLVTKLTALERLIATLPRNAQYTSFYRKQAADAQVTDVLTLGQSMELTLHPADAKELLDSSEHGQVQQHFRLLKNSLAVIRFTRTLRENMFTSAILQQENKLLVDGFTDFWEEGKVRAPHETPSMMSDALRNRPNLPVYQQWTDIRQQLSLPEQDIHPILLAIITTYHLAYSYPFMMFNLQTLLLAAFSIIKPTKYWVSGTVSIISAIWKTLQKTDFTFDPAPDHFTRYAEMVLKDLYKQVEVIHDALLHQSSIPAEIRASLNDRQIKILTYFKQHKKLSRKKYSQLMDIAIATAFRDLNDLALKGLIKSVGKGRGTSYILANIPTPGELPNHEASDTIERIEENEISFEI